MPDPIKPTQRIVGPLTDRHYCLLGRVITAWSTVELRLAHTVAMVSGAKVRSVLFAFQNMTARAKLDTARSVVSADGFDDLRATFTPLLKEAAQLSAIRHVAAHSVWLGLTARGRMVAVDIEVRRERAQIGRVSWAEREFVTTIRGLDDLTVKLHAIGQDYQVIGLRAEEFDETDFS